ncbi:Hypothetical predicted protein [Octopus vulgaris]|uniref:Uncharacterized protein n=1 Tax=Octopus vulgaris TaxID=6645 RepID=A0AA36BZI6_OCTVU|nr:Hypothetical predicted protein [Octopus vulgaris]
MNGENINGKKGRKEEKRKKKENYKEILEIVTALILEEEKPKERKFYAEFFCERNRFLLTVIHLTLVSDYDIYKQLKRKQVSFTEL